ncbi:NAD(P)H-dependent glycerol-3-phosphate dehydrogenase [Halanaerobacter jeridensis]|uniref:Glycerol-3-phosphate dehydrogenase [NAD(P)+] n=1 Tax=Halanaerobacter jeridensis TaxID=706427 RepID=A0A938XSG6_9FIRM|nr:NAD(P)H-dependent glycerol-3-phosphate dehydrogenase [Halanaerobacter jeridensis]MBM7556009.1 glycerol-3-phosphate dehydrogenase (NAD(P)+) [Halanaerobacter jeridensis]
MSKKVAVIGGGSWGTALAQVLHNNNYQVQIYDLSQEKVDEINQDHINSYLPDVKLPEQLKATTDLKEAVNGAEAVVVVVPSHAVRKAAKDLAEVLETDTLVVSATKGLEENTYLRMSEVLAQELPAEFEDKITVLSGPSHAEEVIKNHPTTVVAANEDKKMAQQVQDMFMNDQLRVYTNPDAVGVELGAAVKNIIAIGAGIASGLGYGDNALAALVTRGITEIKRLGVELGAKSMTFAGLTGLGDLIVTCTSQHSRNRRLGYKIGAGKSLEEALDEMKMVAEGVKTAKAVYEVAEKHGIDMPISNQVYNILFNDKDPRQSVNDLMMRGKKHEIEEVAKEQSW